MIRRYENEHEVDLLINDDEHYEEYTRDHHFIHRSSSKGKGKYVVKTRR